VSKITSVIRRRDQIARGDNALANRRESFATRSLRSEAGPMHVAPTGLTGPNIMGGLAESAANR
jgi:hypothetical protein